jgi:hypothetical protein
MTNPVPDAALQEELMPKSRELSAAIAKLTASVDRLQQFLAARHEESLGVKTDIERLAERLRAVEDRASGPVSQHPAPEAEPDAGRRADAIRVLQAFDRRHPDNEIDDTNLMAALHLALTEGLAESLIPELRRLAREAPG